MLGTFITLDSTFATTTMGYAGTLLSDLSPYLTLVIGVLIAVLVATVLIKALKK